MKKVIFLLILFSRFFTICYSQDIKVISPMWNNSLNRSEKEFGKYQEVQLNNQTVTELYNSRIEQFTLPLKDENNKDILADMVLQAMSDVKVKINNASYSTDVVIPLLYKGSIRGYEGKNNVMLTVAPDFISMQAILPGISLSLEKVVNTNSNNYVLFNSRDTKFPSKPFSCGTLPPTQNDIERLGKMQNHNSSKLANPSDKCLFVFVDCTENLFIHYGRSVQNTVNNIYAIWNDVRTAFNNEQLNMGISEINVWTSTVPFNTSSRELGIQTFAAYYKNNYWGNMAMLLDWNDSPNFGVAGGYGWAKGIAPNVCGNYNPNPNPVWNHGSYIYNDLNYFGNYQNYPVPARAEEVYIFTHEIGHLLGSFHTHSCNWLLSTNPNVFGAIDNCAPMEGACTAGPAPVNGGTFMSYCIGPGEFMNFNKGFGPLPGQAIRAFVDGNDCLTNCIGCFSNITVGPIPFQGVYQYEATNQITANGIINGNASTIVKIDAGVKIILAPGFKATQGGKVKIFIDGCGGIR